MIRFMTLCGNYIVYDTLVVEYQPSPSDKQPQLTLHGTQRALETVARGSVIDKPSDTTPERMKERVQNYLDGMNPHDGGMDFVVYTVAELQQATLQVYRALITARQEALDEGDLDDADAKFEALKTARKVLGVTKASEITTITNTLQLVNALDEMDSAF